MSLITINPFGTNYPDGSQLANNVSGRQGEQLGADLHGPWYNANVRRNLFSFVLDNASIGNMIGGPGNVATNGLVSTFVLANPASSGVSAELVSTMFGHSNATTVVGTVGWYIVPATSSQTATAVAPTLTKAVAGTNYFSGRVGDTPNGQVIPYTSATFTTTGGGLIATKVENVCTIGAATDVSVTIADKLHFGRVILPPGQTIYLGANTSAMPSANLQVVWAEWPFT